MAWLHDVHERSGHFASFFEDKVRAITKSTVVDPYVYNGRRKIVAGDHMFMSTHDFRKCLESIKLKNTEGYDRIPQRVLVDGIEHLLPPFSKLIEYLSSFTETKTCLNNGDCQK